MHDIHEGLRGSGHRSVIPYVHGECCCIVVCLFKSWVELAQNALVAPAVLPAFYSTRPRDYTMTQGPIGGHRVEEILCHI
jgi:hypothetical protein